MTKDIKPEMPKVLLATEHYVEIQMGLTREQFDEKMTELDKRHRDDMDSIIDRHNDHFYKMLEKHDKERRDHMRWLIGIGIALIVAVLVRPYLG